MPFHRNCFYKFKVGEVVWWRCLQSVDGTPLKHVPKGLEEIRAYRWTPRDHFSVLKCRQNSHISSQQSDRWVPPLSCTVLQSSELKSQNMVPVCFDFLIGITLQVTQTESIVYIFPLVPSTAFFFFITSSTLQTGTRTATTATKAWRQPSRSPPMPSHHQVTPQCQRRQGFSPTFTWVLPLLLLPGQRCKGPC